MVDRDQRPWQSPEPKPATSRGARHAARTDAPVRRQGRLDASRWHWLLFIPVIVPLAVPLYNRIEPTLGGVPFYYWGQLSFALLASAVVTIVHLATKDR